MIAVECYADTRLIRLLGAPKATIKHAEGKGKVMDLLHRGIVNIGMVDEDPDSIVYPSLRRYSVVETEGTLRLLESSEERGRRVIMVMPRLEEWLLNRARQAKILPLDYGLPSDPRMLHGRHHYEEHPRFKPFIECLLAVDGELKKIRDWIHRFNKPRT